MIGRTACADPEAKPTVTPPPSPSLTPVIRTFPLAGTGIAKVLPCLVNVTVREYPELSMRTTSPSSTSVSHSRTHASVTCEPLLAWDGAGEGSAPLAAVAATAEAAFASGLPLTVARADEAAGASVGIGKPEACACPISVCIFALSAGARCIVSIARGISSSATFDANKDLRELKASIRAALSASLTSSPDDPANRELPDV